MNKRSCIETVSFDLKLGKSKLRIFQDGCVKCGTTRARNWHSDSAINIITGSGKQVTLPIRVCDECHVEMPSLF